MAENNPLRKEYLKQRKRVQNYVSTLRRQGFEVDFYIPDIKKNVTKEDIDSYKSITPKEIREYAYKVTSHGVLFDYEEVKSLEKSYSGKNGVNNLKYDLIESNFFAMVDRFPTYASPTIHKWWDTLVKQYGREKTLIALDEGVRSGLVLTHEISYDRELLDSWMRSFMSFFNFKSDFDMQQYEYIIGLTYE